jgi:hypothetical protein
LDEYGVFNDEGMIAGPFYSLSDAVDEETALKLEDEPNTEVLPICPDHPEQRRDACEECNAQ